MRRSVAAARLGALALLGALAASPRGGTAPRAPVERAIAAAALAHDVPPELLAAVAFAESRLSTRGASGPKARGWVRLLDFRERRSRRRAGALLGTTPAALDADPALALRGAAALLSDAARLTGVRRGGVLPDWAPALSYFHGTGDPLADALYADYVLGIARAGVATTDDDGLPVAFAPPRNAGAPTPSPAAGRPDGVVGAAYAPFVPAAAATHRPPAPGGRAVRFVVIHAMENSFATIAYHARRPTTRAAAHYLVRSFDGLTVQMIDERAVAFHDACFNDASIGVEHEGYVAAGERWFDDTLYRASARLVRDIAARHGVPLDRAHILGHGEAPDCSDHSDPGPRWDWHRFMRLVRGEDVAAR